MILNQNDRKLIENEKILIENEKNLIENERNLIEASPDCIVVRAINLEIWRAMGMSSFHRELAKWRRQSEI